MVAQSRSTLPAGIASRLFDGDERIAVTGATGWFGANTMELLAHALGADAFRRRITAYASTAKILRLRDNQEVSVRALADLPTTTPHPTHILHFAALTRGKVSDVGHDAYLRLNLDISLKVHRALAALHPAGFFFTSSGAVYDGGRQLLATDLQENPYGSLKHLDELAFSQACANLGTTCVTARVFSVSGPYMTQPTAYALGDLITQATRSDRLLVRSRGPVWRSYTAVRDVVAIALAALLDKCPVSMSFETGGDRIEVGQLADRVRRALGRPELPIVREYDPTAQGDEYVGDGQMMHALATRYNVDLCDLDDQIRDTANDLSVAA